MSGARAFGYPIDRNLAIHMLLRKDHSNPTPVGSPYGGLRARHLPPLDQYHTSLIEFSARMRTMTSCRRIDSLHFGNQQFPSSR